MKTNYIAIIEWDGCEHKHPYMDDKDMRDEMKENEHYAKCRICGSIFVDYDYIKSVKSDDDLIDMIKKDIDLDITLINAIEIRKRIRNFVVKPQKLNSLIRRSMACIL